MTREEWAEAERLAAQEAAIAHEREVAAAAERESRDQILAWLNAAPVGDIWTESALAAAVRATVERHHECGCEGCAGGPACVECAQEWPCDTWQDVAEALGIPTTTPERTTP